MHRNRPVQHVTHNKLVVAVATVYLFSVFAKDGREPLKQAMMVCAGQSPVLLAQFHEENSLALRLCYREKGRVIPLPSWESLEELPRLLKTRLGIKGPGSIRGRRSEGVTEASGFPVLPPFSGQPSDGYPLLSVLWRGKTRESGTVVLEEDWGSVLLECESATTSPLVMWGKFRQGSVSPFVKWRVRRLPPSCY